MTRNIWGSGEHRKAVAFQVEIEIRIETKIGITLPFVPVLRLRLGTHGPEGSAS
jgi:hypothetical protein